MANCIYCSKEIGEGMRICQDCAKPQSDEFIPGEGLIEFDDWGGYDEKKELRPDVSSSLVESYNLFQEKLSPKCDIVYYPSCDLDSSPSIAFEKSRIIYVDIAENPIKILKDHGYEAHVADAKKFKPDEPVDILILLNPGETGVAPVKFLADQGYVLCNDYHDTATKLVQRGDLEFVAIIREDENKKKIFDSENPDEYWKEVSSDEELKTKPLYDFILKTLKKVHGEERLGEIIKRGEIVSEYTKILDSEEDILDESGFPIVLFDLPRKKGNMDNIFVFRKIKKVD